MKADKNGTFYCPEDGCKFDGNAVEIALHVKYINDPEVCANIFFRIYMRCNNFCRDSWTTLCWVDRLKQLWRLHRKPKRYHHRVRHWWQIQIRLEDLGRG